MKIFILILFFFNTPASPLQGLKLKARNSTFLTNQAFRSGVIRRCKHYKIAKRHDCNTAGENLMETLDIENILVDKDFNKYQTVTFRKKLKELSNKTESGSYLYILKNELKLIPDATFNLWDFTLGFFKNKNKAIEHIAILFQDILSFETAPQLIYLESIKANPAFINELRVVLDLINQKIRKYSDRTSFLYPEKIWNDFDGSETNLFYHFYVISYLSNKLFEETKSEELSFFIPFSFNYIYELILLSWKTSEVFYDPKVFDSEENIKDIYMAYIAANFSLDRENEISFDDFSNRATENFRELVKESVN